LLKSVENCRFSTLASVAPLSTQNGSGALRAKSAEKKAPLEVNVADGQEKRWKNVPIRFDEAN
jgi:hypothetical protein